MNEDLNSAAPALVDKVKEFLDDSAEAAARFDELTKQLEEMAQGLDDEWSRLADAAKALAELVGVASADLEEDKVPDAGGAVVGVEIALGEREKEVEAELRDAGERVAALAGGAQVLADNLPTALDECLETPVAALVNQTRDTEQALDALFGEATRYLTETYVPKMDEEVAEVEGLSGTTVYNSNKIVARLVTVFPDWARKYAQAFDLVEAGGFTAAGDHVRAVVDHTRSEMDTWHSDALAVLLGRLIAVRDALTELAAEVRTKSGELTGPTERFTEVSAALAVAMAQANAALVRAAGALQAYGHL